MSALKIAAEFDPLADAILYLGDCLDLLVSLPDGFARLVITSPPYNLGKPYESRLDLDEYLSQQRAVIAECARVVGERGSICWQVGNYVDDGEIIPLDIVLSCQFPVELVERLVLALTNEGDWILDPFMGVGTTAIAALMHRRRAVGAEIMPEYMAIGRERIQQAEKGMLCIRPMERAVYDPDEPTKNLPPRVVRLSLESLQPQLFEEEASYTVQEQAE